MASQQSHAARDAAVTRRSHHRLMAGYQALAAVGRSLVTLLNEEFRVVQMTPPGSACSITIGVGITDAEPGSYRGTHLVVTDIEAAHAELVGRGVEVGEIRHMTPEGWQPGVDPGHARYNSFADFADPDGNTWVLQEVPEAAS